MDEKLREVLVKQVHLYPSQKSCQPQCVAGVFIRLSKANLSLIRPGMFWYEDNTISETLTSEKKLKSVVLFVREHIVYGDTFQQRYMLGCRVADYLKDIQLKYKSEFGQVCRPNIEDLKCVYRSLSDINASIKKLKKLIWSEEIYLADSVSPDKLNWVDMFDGGEGKIFCENGAYFRPLIAFMTT